MEFIAKQQQNRKVHEKVQSEPHWVMKERRGLQKSTYRSQY
ncbi:hypothetical protein AB06_4496 [Escherichia coli 2-474-04_S1_C1]|nr:hypothetical protein AB06_4496 [Escherichia coli 2-474-04_S1_C1]